MQIQKHSNALQSINLNWKSIYVRLKSKISCFWHICLRRSETNMMSTALSLVRQSLSCLKMRLPFFFHGNWISESTSFISKLFSLDYFSRQNICKNAIITKKGFKKRKFRDCWYVCWYSKTVNKCRPLLPPNLQYCLFVGPPTDGAACFLFPSLYWLKRGKRRARLFYKL
jgi:hypothetical protein